MPEDATLAALILAVLARDGRPLTPGEIIAELERLGAIVEDEEPQARTLDCRNFARPGTLLSYLPIIDQPRPYGLLGLSLRYGLPAPYGLLMLSGEYRLPYRP